MPTEGAHEMVRRLAREEGLFVGVSAGAAAAAALKVAEELEEGCVVTVFPDAGYKYLSDKTLWGA
jgi:cysteine synthase B